MRNAGLDDEQAGVKSFRRGISKLIYAGNTTCMQKAKQNLRAS